jgi:mono/diheme cytochrome c family protein/DNA-binding beta-propeller fold protein YncE
VGTLRARFTQPVEREPRGVTVSADGRYAFVAHAVGSTITRVDIRDIETTTKRLSAVKSLKLAGHDYLPRRRRTFGCFGFGDPLSHHGLLSRGTSRAGGSNEHQRFAVQGFALASLDDRVALPLVLSHRGEAVSGGYGGGDMRSYPAHQPALVTWKIGSESPHIRVAHTSFPASTSRGHFAGRGGTGCMLPRAATLDARRDELLVSCLGIDEVRAYALNDAGSGPTSLRRSLRGRWKVGPGTFGIASDSSTGEVFAYSQFDKALSVIQRATPRTDERPGERPVAVDAGEDVMLSRSYPLAPIEGGSVDARFDRGRRLVHASGDARISNDGRACASCHPDGRDDGLTWPSPNGPRQTPMLAGRLEGTAPYGWVGEEQTIEGHLKHTFERLGGRGLGGAELDALVHYVRSLPVPKPRATAPDATLVARGRELFHADTVGCGTCHTQGGIGSDGSNHEVGSGPKLDTPSLRFIAGTAPYFHDGRYRTLGELLRQTQGTMGWGGELSDNDLQALEAYMRTL